MKQQLETLLPFEMIATKKWLSAQGMARHSLDNALKSGKLVSLAVGVYARAEVPVSWAGVVASLQRMSTVPAQVGGITALELQGFGHYLSASRKKNIHIYSSEKLPPWLGRLDFDVTFHWHGTKILWSEDMQRGNELCKGYSWRTNMPEIHMSSPEKACLEMLVDVPKAISFEHADELMQGLTSLSPRRLDKLLKACANVKAKRLFLWFAKRQGYSWAAKLSPEEFDLGQGKRVVAKGGKLDSTYQITVPEHMHGSK